MYVFLIFQNYIYMYSLSTLIICGRVMSVGETVCWTSSWRIPGDVSSTCMYAFSFTSKWPVLTLRPTCKNRNKHSDINQNWIATMSKLKQMSMICLHILKIPDMFSCCKKFMTCKRTLELYEHQWLGHVLVISSDQRRIFKYLFIITSLLTSLRGKTRDGFSEWYIMNCL